MGIVALLLYANCHTWARCKVERKGTERVKKCVERMQGSVCTVDTICIHENFLVKYR